MQLVFQSRAPLQREHVSVSGMESIENKVGCLNRTLRVSLQVAPMSVMCYHLQSLLPRPCSDKGRVSMQVLFLNASEEINSNPHEYNALMLNIARSFNLNRIKKCTQIMGREESDDLSAAQIFYPCIAVC